MMDIATAHGTPVISTTVQAIEAPATRNSSQPSSSAMSATTGEAAGVPAVREAGRYGPDPSAEQGRWLAPAAAQLVLDVR